MWRVQEAATRSHPRSFQNPAPVDYPYDYNRDQRADVSDENLARVNTTNFLTALKLLNFAVAGMPSPAGGLRGGTSQIGGSWFASKSLGMAMEDGRCLSRSDAPLLGLLESQAILEGVPAAKLGGSLNHQNPWRIRYGSNGETFQLFRLIMTLPEPASQ